MSADRRVGPCGVSGGRGNARAARLHRAAIGTESLAGGLRCRCMSFRK